jgi:methylglutaconyl-CoA hydratase
LIRTEIHVPEGKDRAFGEIILDRPDKRNALTVEMLNGMVAAAGEMAKDTRIGAVVLRGEGRTFCSGFDMPACVDRPGLLGDLLRGLSKVIRVLRRLPVPVVAAVQGGAVAGGCALLCAADLVVTEPSAKLGYPVVKLGISPAVNAPVLVNCVGEHVARALLLDPMLISGEEARRIGLARILVMLPDDVVPRAQNEAMKFALKPRAAMARTKAWLNEIDGSLDDAALDRALEASLRIVGSAEQRVLMAEMFGG